MPGVLRASICRVRTSPCTPHFAVTYELMYGVLILPSSEPMTTRLPPPVRRNAASAARATLAVPSRVVCDGRVEHLGGHVLEAPVGERGRGVHDPVDRAEPRSGGAERRLQRLGVADVGDRHEGAGRRAPRTPPRTASRASAERATRTRLAPSRPGAARWPARCRWRRR